MLIGVGPDLPSKLTLVPYCTSEERNHEDSCCGFLPGGGVCRAGIWSGPGQAPAPPATDTVAPDIPGAVKAGTKVIVIKDDFQGTEGPIALPDGTVAFTEGGANRITRIDKDGKVSVYLENTNGSNALAFDSKGRLISVQRGLRTSKSA